jgi:hypothetical protein
VESEIRATFLPVRGQLTHLLIIPWSLPLCSRFE